METPPIATLSRRAALKQAHHLQGSKEVTLFPPESFGGMIVFTFPDALHPRHTKYENKLARTASAVSRATIDKRAEKTTT